MNTIGIPLAIENKYVESLQYNTVLYNIEYYNKCLTSTVKANIELFKQLPKPNHFNWEKLLSHVESEIKKAITQDKLFEDKVELSKYAHSMNTYMHKYYQKTKPVSENSKERNNQDSRGFSKIFLNSNLPDCFLSIVTRSFLVENDFSDLYQRKIDKEKIGLIANQHNNRKFERLCDNHNHWVKGFTEKVTAISRNRTKLIWYIDLNNSKTLEELFKEKQVSTTNLDINILQQLMETVENETNVLEQMMIDDPDAFDWTLSIEKTDGMRIITEMINTLDS